MFEKMFLWMIIAYGITSILVYGSIFAKTRNLINKLANDEGTPSRGFWEFLSNMLKCVLCTSTWVGFFLGLFIYSPVYDILDVSLIVSWFFDGMFCSGSVWAINAIIEWFEVNRPKEE
jgi:hypothetical protein